MTVGGDPIASVAETPKLTPRVELFEAGADRLRTGVVFPTGHRPGDGPLPVLMDPYGGPGGQRVLAAQSAFLVSQWFADQGFVVVVADGRGTPGRGPRWERTVYGNRGDLPLEDQIVALHAAAQRYPDLNLSRVGIRGWSFGGYLATLAVLRRPDVFHAAVAGAPVTDQRLYDTHWQERYLGHPDLFPQQYDRSSLLADAPNLRRPLIRIHGLLDDNVHPAHTMRLSGALLAAGRPHTVVPLSTATHGPREQIANLLVLEAQFLNNALAQPNGPDEADPPVPPADPPLGRAPVFPGGAHRELGDQSHVGRSRRRVYLWAVVSARDLGFIGRPEARARLTATLTEVQSLKRSSGFLYQWYDTTTGHVIRNPGDIDCAGETTPAFDNCFFISNVDNGWYASGLIVTRQAMPELGRLVDGLLSPMRFGLFYDNRPQRWNEGLELGATGSWPGSRIGL